MTTTPHDTIPTPSAGTLADLRAVALESSQSATRMFHTADCQAWMLQNLLPRQADRIPPRLSDLIPSILVDYLDNLPVPGTAFWGNNHWHIHVRAGDPADVQAFTILHELKHIIDHPLRRQPNSLSNTDWEALADYFATRVLTQETNSDHTSVTMDDDVNNKIPADMHHSSSHSKPETKTQTGGTR